MLSRVEEGWLEGDILALFLILQEKNRLSINMMLPVGFLYMCIKPWKFPSIPILLRDFVMIFIYSFASYTIFAWFWY